MTVTAMVMVMVMVVMVVLVLMLSLSVPQREVVVRKEVRAGQPAETASPQLAVVVMSGASSPSTAGAGEGGACPRVWRCGQQCPPPSTGAERLLMVVLVLVLVLEVTTLTAA
jgi:hypothetical protein